MGKGWKLGLALAGAMACAASSGAATGLTVAPPVAVAPGWTRIAGRYTGVEGIAVEPVFRAVARCAGREDVRVVDGVVQHVARNEGAVWLDVPTTPERLARATPACGTPELVVEMRVGAELVAMAPVPPPVEEARRTAPVVDVAEPVRRSRSPLRLKGDKYGSARFGKRTEAGVEWTLDSRVSIQLNYERTSQSPMSRFDHDDGILTRVRIGF